MFEIPSVDFQYHQYVLNEGWTAMEMVSWSWKTEIDETMKAPSNRQISSRYATTTMSCWS